MSLNNKDHSVIVVIGQLTPYQQKQSKNLGVSIKKNRDHRNYKLSGG